MSCSDQRERTEVVVGQQVAQQLAGELAPTRRRRSRPSSCAGAWHRLRTSNGQESARFLIVSGQIRPRIRRPPMRAGAGVDAHHLRAGSGWRPGALRRRGRGPRRAVDAPRRDDRQPRRPLGRGARGEPRPLDRAHPGRFPRSATSTGAPRAGRRRRRGSLRATRSARARAAQGLEGPRARGRRRARRARAARRRALRRSSRGRRARHAGAHPHRRPGRVLGAARRHRTSARGAAARTPSGRSPTGASRASTRLLDALEALVAAPSAHDVHRRARRLCAEDLARVDRMLSAYPNLH